ncbi:sigma-54-dependent Fis family transcriptional regulator [Neobacillus mesonae]|uniref:sigma-54 interaction domain-containing protein n=1 Tax=Neobacillus mesonae TaxID=1193713 RepID=UPI00203E38B9|nr:sigma 54-interacting transcriptional regulator [Neobacillus mesonae]MCM3570591.1 sigma 54-interacting transcriptional regulator [Neobacillus mesonae]
MEQLLKMAGSHPQFFLDILNSINDSIYIADKYGNTLWINHTSELICRVPREKLIGRNVKEVEKEGIFTPSVIRLALESNSTVSTVQEVGDGKYITSGHLVKDQNDEVIAAVAHGRDITEAVKTTSQLKETQELLEKYSQEIRKLTVHSELKSTPAEKSLLLDPSIENLIEKIAKVDATALIIGETGTGKTVVAKRVHLLSKQHKGPFIHINCASIPETLIESELFGYTKGAFTGAHSAGKEGLIRAADGGTLFFDEIGEIPLTLQAKLLHFLQTKEYLPIGAREYHKANVRVIAATNRNLEKMVEEGSFRSDLFYRLNVLSIKMPPLRDRKEEMNSFTSYFLQHYNEKYNVKKTITPKVLEIFQTYHWPGNVRELENLMERLVILSEQEIDENDLPHKMLENTNLAISMELSLSNASMPHLLESMEKKMILDALQKENSTRKAAKFLGVTQSLLMRRIRKYGIQLQVE